MIAVVQILIKYALFESFTEVTNATNTYKYLYVTLNGIGFTLLVLATISIAAAGYIINDIYDVETDLVNKPEKVLVGKVIPENKAFNLFIALNLIGVSIGFYLSSVVDNRFFFVLFILISTLLYLYATHLKELTLVGNIVVSIIVASSILIVGLFDLIPVITEANRETQLTFFEIVIDYTVFAFIINLLREIAKDIEDIDGDYKSGRKTIPIVLGRERAKYILLSLMILSIIGIVYYLLKNLYTQQEATAYFLVFIIGPLIFLCIKTFGAKTKKDFNFISKLLKIVMLFGMLSLVLYQFILLK